MAEERSEKLATIRAYCAQRGPPPPGVLFDEPGGLLLDVASGKTVPVDAADLERVETKTNTETKRPYLLLVYGSGRQRVLSDVGIAFPPDFRNTGPVAELTEAVCFRDFFALRDRLKHELYGHADQPLTRDTLKLMMMCIAVLDGADAAGFDVAAEARELDKHMGELERRAPPPGQ